MRHELKTWPEPFSAVFRGCKRFEWRKNDRDFHAGDVLVLQEWSPYSREYSGRRLEAFVTYVAYGPDYGIPEGYCVMSLGPVEALPLGAP